ncbi:MAG: hypothetical protein K8T91_02170 [Planctomycetes bacterium]|nr:hypothetical protein [Planctomycetota bacterium]
MTTGSSTYTDTFKVDRYDATNSLIGSTITVDSATDSYPYGLGTATIGADEDGSFVVAWTRITEDVPTEILFHLRTQRYTSGGATVGSAAEIDTVDGTVLAMEAESDAAGNLVVSWNNLDWDDFGAFGIKAVAINPAGAAGTPVLLSGTPGTPEAVVSNLILTHEWMYSGSKVHVLQDGRLFVTYKATQYESGEMISSKVLGRYFNAAGTPLGEAFDIAASPNYRDGFASVAGNGYGSMLVAWNDSPETADTSPPVSRDASQSAVIARFIGPQASPAYSVDSDSVGFKPLSIYTRPISVEVATGHVVFHTDRGPDGQGDGILPVYRQTSDFNPIVSVDYVVPVGQTTPSLLEVKLKFAGHDNAESVFYSLAGVQPGQVARLVLQADRRDLPTGRYNYQVEVIEHRGEEESKPKLLTGAADIVNRRDSEFGVGWWLDSLDRIVTGGDGYYDGHDGGGRGVLLVRGDGTTGWFAENSDGGYDTPAGSFTTLVKNIGGDFTLTHTDGTEDKFLSDGRLDKRTDRNGNVIDYEYDTADVNSNGVQNELKWIKDIYGLSTTYTYAGGRLDYVTDFADRVTDFQIGTTGDTTGYVNKIVETDPDGAGELTAPETDFTYYVGSSWDGDLFQGLLHTITTPGIQTPSGVQRPVTTILYDAAGRFDSATSGDGTTWELTAAQTIGLATGSTDESPVAAVTPDQIKATYKNERNYVSTYTVDRFGYQTSTTDPLSHTWKYSRDSNGLIRRKTEPAGAGGTANLGPLVTSYRYDDVGNLLKATYPQATLSTSDPAGTLISETWEYYGVDKFYQLKKHTDQRGYVTHYELTDDDRNVEEIRQQVDIASTTYVSDDATKWITTRFEYTTAATTPGTDLPGGLVTSTVVGYGTDDAVETIYDYYQNGVNGAVASEHGLLASITSAYDTAVESTTYHIYDVRRNPLVVTNDPFLLGEAGESLGALERTVEYDYDNLNRLTREIGLATADHDAPAIDYEYDAEGNLISVDDPEGAEVYYDYDAMARLVRTRLPEPVGHASTDQHRPETVLVYDAAGNLFQEKVLVTAGASPELNVYRVTTHDYDARNLRIKTTLPAPGYTAADAKLPSNSGQNIQPVIRYTHDSAGNVAFQSDPRFGADPNATIGTHYTYDSLHRVTSVKTPKPTGAATDPITTYVYFDDGLVKEIQSPGPNGTVTTQFTYDGLGRVVKKVDPEAGGSNNTQLTTLYTYDSRSNVKSVQEWQDEDEDLSRTTNTYYDELNRVIAVDGPDADGEHLGVSMYYVHNVAGEVSAMLAFAGNVDEDDVEDNRITIEELNDRMAAVQAQTDRNNIAQKTTYVYDKLGRVKETLGPAPGSVQTFATYDIRGNLTQQEIRFYDTDISDDPVQVSLITLTQYDALGRPWKVQGPIVSGSDRTETQIAYNVDGTVSQQKVKNPNDADGWSTTIFGYDGLGRVDTTLTEDAANIAGSGYVTTTVWRDALGNITRLKEATGLETHTRYDAAGMVKWQDVQREQARIGSQNHSNMFLRTEYTYKPSGHVATQKQQALDGTKGVVLDQYGNGTSYTYDDLGHVKEQAQDLASGGQSVTKFDYNVFGAVTKVTDPQQNVTTYEVDNLGRATSETVTHAEAAAAGTRTFAYDSFGHLLDATDRNDKTTQFTYDNLGHRVREEWVDGNYAKDYIFSALGELKQAKNTDSTGIVSQYDYTYDAGRRLELSRQQIRPLDSAIVDFIYEHDLLGNVSSVTADLANAADEFVNSYQYDNVGRLKGASQLAAPGGGGQVKSKTVTLDHRYDGHALATRTRRYDNSTATGTVTASTLQRTQFGGGVTYVEHFKNDLSPGDATGTSYQPESKTIELQILAHDPRGLVALKSSSIYDIGYPDLRKTTAVAHKYDPFGQLKEVKVTAPNGTASTQEFKYDANGNPINGSVSGDYNQLLQDKTHAYEYDKEGNTEFRWTYGWLTESVSPPNDDKLETVERTWKAGAYRLTFDGLLFDNNTFVANWDEDDGLAVEIRIGSTVVHTIENLSIVWNSQIGKWVPVVPEPIWITLADDIASSKMIVDFDYRIITIFTPDITTGSSYHVDKVKGLDVLTWDRANRLTQVANYSDINTVGTVLERMFPVTGTELGLRKYFVKEYTYDALDRPIAEALTTLTETTPGNLTEATERKAFVWERDQRVLDYDDQTSGDSLLVTRFYAPGMDNILAAQAPVSPGSSTDVTLWGMTDQQKSTIAVAYYALNELSEPQLYVERVSYNAQGQVGFSTDLGTPPYNVITTPAVHLGAFYTGREHDFATGFDNFRSRPYDPGSGRFLSQDSIGLASGDTNPYRFGFNSHPNATDPSGHVAQVIWGAAIGAGVYGIQAAITGEWDWVDFGISVGAGALTGGVSAFVGRGLILGVTAGRGLAMGAAAAEMTGVGAYLTSAAIGGASGAAGGYAGGWFQGYATTLNHGGSELEAWSNANASGRSGALWGLALGTLGGGVQGLRGELGTAPPSGPAPALVVSNGGLMLPGRLGASSLASAAAGWPSLSTFGGLLGSSMALSTRMDNADEAIEEANLPGMRERSRGIASQQGREFRTDQLEIYEFDQNAPRHVRGWLENERRMIEQGRRPYARNPPGYEQAHGRTTPAREGYDYSNSRLQGTDLNDLEERVRLQQGKP